jgi:hypothetical protein
MSEFLKCKMCGQDYVWNSELGYSRTPPICSAFCNGRKAGLAEQEAMISNLKKALSEAETVIRHAVQESTGRVKAEIVGGWLYHANKVRAAIAKAGGK